MVDLVIFGAGAAGREVLAIANDCRARDPGLVIKGFLDRNPPDLASYDVPVLGYEDYQVAAGDRFVVALGDAPQRRWAREWLEARGGQLHTLVHPLAWVGPTARLEAGCIIAAFAFVAVDTHLGANVFLNNYASVGHDSTLGADSVLCPYATLNGDVTAGPGCFLGTHATVTRGATLGSQVRVTAGSVVYGTVPDRALAHGNRAKKRVLASSGQAGWNPGRGRRAPTESTDVPNSA